MRNSPNPSVLSREAFVNNLVESGLFPGDELNRALPDLRVAAGEGDALGLARAMTAAGKLTPFQAEALLDGRTEELVLGNYELLDRLGAGGMGTVCALVK